MSSVNEKYSFFGFTIFPNLCKKKNGQMGFKGQNNKCIFYFHIFIPHFSPRVEICEPG